MKEKIYNIVVSIICCVYAITTIVFLFALPKYNLLFPGWWTFILMFPSLGNLLFQKNKVSSAFVLTSGILLLLASLEVISFTKCFTILICFAIIIIGMDTDKSEFIKGESILIDDSFAERNNVYVFCGIPVFDVDAVESLFDWSA